jgi:hypothetical protein
MATLNLVAIIHAPRERCFDLARSVDLHLESAAHTSEAAISGRTTGLLGLGDEVSWRGRHLGLLLTLTSRITSYERPTRFCEGTSRPPLKTTRERIATTPVVTRSRHFFETNDEA